MYWTLMFNIENYLWPLEESGSKLTIHPDDMLDPNFDIKDTTYVIDNKDDNNRTMPDIG